MKRFPKKNLFNRFIVSFIVFLVVFLMYTGMLPTDLTTANNGADGGDLLSAILTGGIPHPTGYPTYLIFGKLFQLIPFGTPYFKGALLSAVFSSFAVGLLAYYFWVAHFNEQNITTGVIATFLVGFSFGTTSLFWSQAVITEVYGLQSFFMVLILIWLMLIIQGEKSKRNDIILSILSFIIGISTGNHVMIILMSPAVLFSYFSAYRSGIKTRKLLKYIGLIIAAVIVVYAILPLRARQFPPINWGNPQTLDGFVWLISGKLYHGLAFGVPLGDILQRIGYYSKFLIEQFGILGLFIGIMGAVKTASTPGKMKWIYFWIFFMYSIFSIGYQTNDSIVYLIPALIVYSIWVGIGIQDLWINFIGNPILGKAVICLFFLILVFRIPDIFDKIDPRKDNTARLFVNHCFDTLPQNAIVLTEGDADTFPLWYYHFGLGQRSDIRVIVESLMNFEWYRETIIQTYPNLVLPEESAEILSDQLSILNPQVSICQSRIDSNGTESMQCVCPPE